MIYSIHHPFFSFFFSVANTLSTQWARPKVTDDPHGTLRAQAGVTTFQVNAGRLGVAHYTELFII